jgi:hypothetical protein
MMLGVRLNCDVLAHMKPAQHSFKGGPMFWADNYIGLAPILSELEKLHRLYPGSDYFRPSELLRKCVSMGLGVQEYYKQGYAKTNAAGIKSKL